MFSVRNYPIDIFRTEMKPFPVRNYQCRKTRHSACSKGIKTSHTRQLATKKKPGKKRGNYFTIALQQVLQKDFHADCHQDQTSNEVAFLSEDGSKFLATSQAHGCSSSGHSCNHEC